MLPPIPQGWSGLVVAFATLSLLVSTTTALEVTPGSKCAAVCMDRSDGDQNDSKGSTTTPSDIVCEDPDFTSSIKGMKFKQCLECMQESRDTKGTESDVHWLLYNLRYAANVCLYNYPASVQNKSSACDIPQACGGLKTALGAGNLNPDNGTQLDYCTADNNKMAAWNIKSCASCLLVSRDSIVLSNFMVALDAGCQQKPAAGALIGLTGSLFAKYGLNVTDPPVLETGPPPPAQTTMNMGTIVGIAVGAALLLLGGVALFVVYWRKQRRARADEKTRELMGPSPTGGSSITALTRGGPGSGPPAGGAYTMDYKKEAGLSSFEYDPRDPNNNGRGGVYSSQGEYYDQHVDSQQQQQAGAKYGMLHAYRDGSTSRAMPAHPAYIPRAAITSHQRSSIESRGSRGTSAAQASPPAQQQHHLRAANANNSNYSTPRSTPRATPEPIVLASPPASKQRYAKTSTTVESYAMQQYLSNPDDGPAAQAIPGPPAGPPPTITTTTDNNSKALAGFDPNNIPPPPPPQAKIPSLVLPAVPKIRMPKKYAPPKISIEEPTPVAGPGEGSFVGGERIVQQTVAKRRRLEELPLASGKSQLYG